ncbi:pentatricopeptide repeat-containing protein At3g28660-like [Dioscorea cayenensis subsp. rotundata]|uniref:Pentatricopeptide repeat-containing protein At3g28660-like n=1 Tax=Dioscorea cayennensis subsp. rotundata TaxID=55577 RepID=A0AB40CV55_DIOCR|nr:pentatricopeptide repeat-containing protein At3g28660-like [Dioscorea cayenensis subsp. rotundata]
MKRSGPKKIKKEDEEWRRRDEDEVTLIALLSVSAHSSDNFSGDTVHLLFFKLGLPFTAASCNATMDMYAKSSRMDEARKLFQRDKGPYDCLMENHPHWHALVERFGRRLASKQDVPEMLSASLVRCLFDGVHMVWLNRVTSQRHTEADDLRMLVKNRVIQKIPGMSFIEINGIVHWFTAGDETHPQTGQGSKCLHLWKGCNKNVPVVLHALCSWNGKMKLEKH